MPDGYIDTNIFLHAETNDPLTPDCRAFVARLQSGSVEAYLDPLVLHELSYVWTRYFRYASRQDVAVRLLTILSWPGIVAETSFLMAAVERWQHSAIGFVDCVLAERALLDNMPVYTKNVRHFRSQGVDAPDPLPR